MMYFKVISFTFAVVLFLAVSLVNVSPAVAQFVTVPTPTPTLTMSPVTGGGTPTATPTKAPSATTPAAGNALPTVMILGAALVFLSLGMFSWRGKFSPKSA